MSNVQCSMSNVDIQNWTFDIWHLTFDIRHSILNIRHSTFNIRHSIGLWTLNIEHWTLNIGHLTFTFVFSISIFLMQSRLRVNISRWPSSGYLKISLGWISAGGPQVITDISTWLKQYLQIALKWLLECRPRVNIFRSPSSNYCQFKRHSNNICRSPSSDYLKIVLVWIFASRPKVIDWSNALHI